MSKRIFTKVFSQAVAAEGAVPATHNAKQSWLAQEDIEVIGASALVYSYQPSENDGQAEVMVELSQVGLINQDGAIIQVAAHEDWNTTPAGICLTVGQATVMFTPLYAIPIKEEGYLYVNALSVGKSAGISSFNYTVTVYYTKGK